ncbi:MAG: hypothetical protein N2V76_07775, partial [Methanophagales archaeon]|nr:hypothetical protein [Methanophagales archaeon]
YYEGYITFKAHCEYHDLQHRYSFTFDQLETDMMIFCEWLEEGVKKASRQATGQIALIGLPVSYLSHLTVMYGNVKC